MVATTTSCSLFPVSPSLFESRSKPYSTKLGFSNLDVHDIRSISDPTKCLRVKANAKTPSKINGNTIDHSSTRKGVKSEEETFINQLPDWSMLLAAITTIFLAAEKQWTMLDWKPKCPDDALIDPFGFGKIAEDGFTFRQNFSIRSYEIGPDRTTSIETVMNHLQETALNHVKSLGILDDGFGSTLEMSKRNLIWVVARMQVLLDRYPTWGDVVQVDTWVSSSGKNGMRRDWLFRDCKTGEILTRASSVWVMMNKHTRKLSKLPDEVRAEITPFFIDTPPITNEDGKKVPKLEDKTAKHICTGLKPKWSDLDINQHVNNVKYIGWILESIPPSILESHELSSMTLEYRRECGRNNVLQSLTAVSRANIGGLLDSGNVECQHLLRLEDGDEIVRARTEWRPKHTTSFGNLNQVPTESA